MLIRINQNTLTNVPLVITEINPLFFDLRIVSNLETKPSDKTSSLLEWMRL